MRDVFIHDPIRHAGIYDANPGDNWWIMMDKGEPKRVTIGSQPKPATTEDGEMTLAFHANIRIPYFEIVDEVEIQKKLAELLVHAAEKRGCSKAVSIFQVLEKLREGLGNKPLRHVLASRKTFLAKIRDPYEEALGPNIRAPKKWAQFFYELKGTKPVWNESLPEGMFIGTTNQEEVGWVTCSGGWFTPVGAAVNESGVFGVHLS